MSDIDKFHELVETQSPLSLREYTHAQAAWQARGKLDDDFKQVIWDRILVDLARAVEESKQYGADK